MASSSSSSSYEAYALQISKLEHERDQKRKLVENLLHQKIDIEKKLKELDRHLEHLDESIETLERKQYNIMSLTAPVVVKSEPDNVKTEPPSSSSLLSFPPTQADEILTDPQQTQTQAEEILTEPTTQRYEEEVEHDNVSTNVFAGNNSTVQNHHRQQQQANSRSSLELTTTLQQPFAVSKKKPPPPSSAENHPNHDHHRAAAAAPKTGTLEAYFAVQQSSKPAQRKDPPLQPMFSHTTTNSTHHYAAQQNQHASIANSSNSTNNRQHFAQDEDPHPAAQYLRSSSSSGGHNDANNNNNFPWSQCMMQELVRTFRINAFREHQKEIINATLSGEDVFVIMRTGGGKSLTYQLPALIEGRRRGNNNKVTFVISPLLSLIQDQVEQMNALAPGSAVSFTSGVGVSEHARRWAQVRDPAGGVCLVYCTPEKVSKSNKLCHEMEKLHHAGRLGRFVIDEAHCCCQWGHDFRPDYAQLGKLKSHFPSIPVIAVTATASDRVRQDVCKILRLGTNYRFFRSTANRPNLTYSVQTKPDRKNAQCEKMAEFIKTKYPRGAGIVYTYSRKDADTVASSLCDYGVTAESYHSDVSATKKEHVHRSWMRNETQVVVATIAFGLGINKPDVRFVLHHSISKTLEAYYQESGRAGRDGLPAECILYYSPKDVIRMLKMVHGTSSEHLLWPMIRYAQESGNDAVCKAIILTHLGEPNCPDVSQVRKENEGITTTPRDVGSHAKTVVQLLHLRLQEGKDMTMAMLVKDWRAAKSLSVPQCVKDNPPAKADLSVEDCERIVISLLLENVLGTNIQWNAYDTVIYFTLGTLGNRILASENPKIVIHLPKRESKKAAAETTKAAKQTKARKTIADKDGDWVSVKPKAKKRKKAAAKKPAAKKAKGTTKKSSATKSAKKRNQVQPERASSEVIELLSDDDDNDDDSTVDVPLASLKTDKTKDKRDNLWEESSTSEEEFEFDE